MSFELGFAQATGVHGRNIVPTHEIRVSVNCMVLCISTAKKCESTIKAHFGHSLGTVLARFTECLGTV